MIDALAAARLVGAEVYVNSRTGGASMALAFAFSQTLSGRAHYGRIRGFRSSSDLRGREMLVWWTEVVGSKSGELSRGQETADRGCRWAARRQVSSSVGLRVDEALVGATR
jgi:hypothetical protein